NGRPIHVSETPSLDEAFVLASGESSFLGSHDRGWFVELNTRSRRTRGFGDFWAHLLVARGAADVALEPERHVWASAALGPVGEEPEENTREPMPDCTLSPIRQSWRFTRSQNSTASEGSKDAFAISSGWKRKSQSMRVCPASVGQRVKAATWSGETLTIRLG